MTGLTTTLTIPPKIGRARYEGPAAGKYVTRNLAASTTNIGIFTATAKLLADFEAVNPHADVACSDNSCPGSTRAPSAAPSAISWKMVSRWATGALP